MKLSCSFLPVFLFYGKLFKFNVNLSFPFGIELDVETAVSFLVSGLAIAAGSFIDRSICNTDICLGDIVASYLDAVFLQFSDGFGIGIENVNFHVQAFAVFVREGLDGIVSLAFD